MGGAADIPWRVRVAEQVLVGQPGDSNLFAPAAAAARAEAAPLANDGYDVPLASAPIGRALATASAVPGLAAAQ